MSILNRFQLRVGSVVTCLAGCLAVFFSANGSVQAGIMFDGETIGYQYLYPSLSDVIFSASPVVGAGVELPGLLSAGGDTASMDISDTNILIDFYESSYTFFAPEIFNGFRIFDIGATLPSIGSVTIAAATNMVGFSAANISFDANNIYVNLQGLDFTPSTIVSLDVAPGVAAVPEPSTLIAFCAVGVVAGVRRLRRRTSVGCSAE